MTRTYEERSPFRKVIGWFFFQSKYARPGHGSNRLDLECGHNNWRKGSVAIPKKARCMECGR